MKSCFKKAAGYRLICITSNINLAICFGGMRMINIHLLITTVANFSAPLKLMD